MTYPQLYKQQQRQDSNSGFMLLSTELLYLIHRKTQNKPHNWSILQLLLFQTKLLTPLKSSLIQVRLFTIKLKVKSLSRVQLFATPWTVGYQALPSVGFSRQQYWSTNPSPVDLPDPVIKPGSPSLQTGALPSEPQGRSCLQ